MTAVISLPLVVKNENFLKLGYLSFEDRTINLSNHIKSCLVEDLSKQLGISIYNFDKLESKFKSGTWETVDDKGYSERYFQDVYKLDKIENFIGIIPNNNQQEIISKLNLLKSNALLEKQDFNLFVLAPMNNFATTSNVIAIDPICFCKIQIRQKYYLLPLTQWV